MPEKSWCRRGLVSRLDLRNIPANNAPVKFNVLMRSIVMSAVLAMGAEHSAQQPASSAPSTKPPVGLTTAEIEIYERAEALIDWTPRRIESTPLLHKLHRAEGQGELPTILKRVGENTVELFSNFPKISCNEEIYSETNQRNPLVPRAGPYRSGTINRFRYIIIPEPVGDLPIFEEYRTDGAGRPFESARVPGPWMFTTNFMGDCIYFSPSDQPHNRFRYFGTQSVQKRECYVVGFAQRPEVARIFAIFQLESRPAALLFQGLAWIDKQSFQIVRIATWLLAPRTDIGLNGENSVVNYFSVQPAGLDRGLWVPHDVTVAVFFRGAVFQNKHRYSNFRLFRVESAIKPVE